MLCSTVIDGGCGENCEVYSVHRQMSEANKWVSLEEGARDSRRRVRSLGGIAGSLVLRVIWLCISSHGALKGFVIKVRDVSPMKSRPAEDI